MPARSYAHLIRSRTLGRLLAVLGTAFVVLGITTLPASAHHPLISATASCDGRISFTSTAWDSPQPEARSNADVRIQVKVNGSWVQVGSGAYTSANHFTFAGSFSEPVGSLPIQLRALAAGRWGDGAGGGSSSETTVGAPSGCQSSNPQASVSHTCTGYTASLDNRASTQAVTFTVTVNGSTTTKTVARGDTGLVTGTLHSGTEYAITVNGDSKQLAHSTFDTDSCQHATPPTARITSTCDTYTVTVHNPGTSDAGYVVRQSGNQVKSGHLAAGATVSYTSNTLTPGSYVVAVTSGGSTVASSTVTIHGCQPVGIPHATINVDCTHGFTTTLNNTASTVATTFVVTTAAGTSSAVQHQVPVAAGATSSPHWPVSNGVAQTLTVSAPSMSQVSSSFNGVCAVVSPPTSTGPTATPTSTPTTTSTQTPSSTPTATTSVAAPQATSSNTPSTSATSSTSATPTSSATISTTGDTQVSAPSSLPKSGNSISSLLLVTGGGMLLTGLMMLMLRRIDATVQS